MLIEPKYYGELIIIAPARRMTGSRALKNRGVPKLELGNEQI